MNNYTNLLTLSPTTAAKYGMDPYYLATVMKNLQFQTYLFNLDIFTQQRPILSFSGALVNSYTINITDSSTVTKNIGCVVLANNQEAICNNSYTTALTWPLVNLSLFNGLNVDPVAFYQFTTIGYPITRIFINATIIPSTAQIQSVTINGVTLNYGLYVPSGYPILTT
jgi:hypothetical protein